MPRLTNPTNGPKGVWIADAKTLGGGDTVWIEPNAYQDVPSLSKAERASFELAGGVVSDNPLDHDGDGKAGGNVISARPLSDLVSEDAHKIETTKRGPGRPPKAE